MNTLSELLPFLQNVRRGPNKRLSQNFLVDPNIVHKIIQLADIDSKPVLEIGPGAGALTRDLMQKTATLFAVEKDPVLATALQQMFLTLHLFSSDILTFDWSLLLPHAPLKVVANLPYHITTPIFEALITHRHLFSTFTLMIQEEVAKRICTCPGTPAFSSFALFLQFHTKVTHSFKVSPTCFYPRPKVASRVLHFTLIQPPIPDEKPLFLLIRRAFQMRRKMIHTSLQPLLPCAAIEQGLDAAQAAHTARPEELSLEQWLTFFAFVKPALHQKQLKSSHDEFSSRSACD